MNTSPMTPDTNDKLTQEQVAIMDLYQALYGHVTDSGDFLIITPLMLHASVYLNPTIDYTCEDRFCMLSIGLAHIAIDEYDKTNTMKFWQKHHNKGISINDNLAYAEGVKQIPENALYEVSWNISELREKHHYELDMLMNI